MKYIVLVFCFLTSNFIFSQIVDLNSIQKKKQNLKDTSVQVFYEMSSYLMKRELSLNPYYNGTVLGEKINETPRRMFSHSLGIRVPIMNVVFLDAGLAWVQNGENYAYSNTDNDSSFIYNTSYRYFGMPVNLNFNLPLNPSNEHTLLGLFLRIGAIPQLYQSYLQKTEWTTSLGSKESEKIKALDNPNTFMFSWHLSSGISLLSKTNYGFKLAVHYKYSLTNTFTKYGDYIHIPYGLGYSLSLIKNL